METIFTVVVSDAGPLIHLDELGCLDLLGDFAQVLVADVVWSEVLHHRPGALAMRNLPLRRVEQREYQITTALQMVTDAFELDPGEASALAVMLGNPGAVFLTDDAAARLAAESLGVTVHGTIGILLRAIRRNQRSVTEVLEVLRKLPERSTLHVAPRLLAAVVAEIEQYPRNVSIHS